MLLKRVELKARSLILKVQKTAAIPASGEKRRRLQLLEGEVVACKTLRVPTDRSRDAVFDNRARLGVDQEDSEEQQVDEGEISKEPPNGVTACQQASSALSWHSKRNPPVHAVEADIGAVEALAERRWNAAGRSLVRSPVRERVYVSLCETRERRSQTSPVLLVKFGLHDCERDELDCPARKKQQDADADSGAELVQRRATSERKKDEERVTWPGSDKIEDAQTLPKCSDRKSTRLNSSHEGS